MDPFGVGALLRAVAWAGVAGLAAGVRLGPVPARPGAEAGRPGRTDPQGRGKCRRRAPKPGRGPGADPEPESAEVPGGGRSRRRRAQADEPAVAPGERSQASRPLSQVVPAGPERAVPGRLQVPWPDPGADRQAGGHSHRGRGGHDRHPRLGGGAGPVDVGSGNHGDDAGVEAGLSERRGVGDRDQLAAPPGLIGRADPAPSERGRPGRGAGGLRCSAPDERPGRRADADPGEQQFGLQKRRAGHAQFGRLGGR